MNFAFENLLLGYRDARQVSGEPERLGFWSALSNRVCLGSWVGSEANARLLIDAQGNFEWGPGGGRDQDVLLYHAFAGMMAWLGFPGGGLELVARQLGPAKIISDATNANPVVITCPGHGFSDWANVYIQGVAGNGNANGARTIHVLDSDHFSLNDVAGNGAYAGGGTAKLIGSVENQPRIAIYNDGTGIQFGDGANSTDVKLYRPTAGQLDLLGMLGIVGEGESFPRVAVSNSGGGLLFSDGAAPPDVSLYRSIPGKLAVDGNFGVTGALSLGTPLSTGNGGTGAASIADARTNLYVYSKAEVDAAIAAAVATKANKGTYTDSSGDTVTL